MRQIFFSCVIALLGVACSDGLSEKDTLGGIGGRSGRGVDAGNPGTTGTPVVCTSQAYWTGGDKGSELMHPGGTCLACHTLDRHAPKYAVAGTVYPTSREPDDCNGQSGETGITVVITDASGKQLPPIPVNGVGNFYYEGTIAGPYQVKVVSNGRETKMSAAPASGDCNSCHTRDGTNSAPGRILAP